MHWKYKSNAENKEGQRVDDSDLPVRSMGTAPPQRQGRGQSSECEQVRESPHSPRHLDAQGQRYKKKVSYAIYSLASNTEVMLMSLRVSAHDFKLSKFLHYVPPQAVRKTIL